MRSHTSLRNDSEANAAASHALRGATVGACKVSYPPWLRFPLVHFRALTTLLFATSHYISTCFYASVLAEPPSLSSLLILRDGRCVLPQLPSLKTELSHISSCLLLVERLPSNHHSSPSSLLPPPPISAHLPYSPTPSPILPSYLSNTQNSTPPQRSSSL